MKKKKSKWIFIGAAIIIVTLILFMSSMISAGTASAPIRYSELYQQELVNSISAKGIVESVNKSNVYSTLGFSIKTVNVEVGDAVTEGQILCQLDTSDLELSIEQQKADLSVSEKNSLNLLQDNQRILNDAASNLKNGTNGQVLNAETALKTAEINLQNAQTNYDNILKDYESESNSQIITAESNVNSSELDLDTKKTSYEKYKLLYEAGSLSKNEYEQAETAYTNAQNKYNDAVAALESAKTAEIRNLEQAETSLNSAKVNYNSAKETLNVTKQAASQEIEKYKSNVEGNQIAANTDSKLLAIQKLQKQFDDSTILAPMSGTVTAVYAKEGASVIGLLFVIEDTDNLKITTKIKEYDVGKVKPDMEVLIKSDSTGEAVYEGKISSIDPAAVKNASGDTASTSDVEFGSQIQVLSPGNDLKIGMNTRLTIVLERKKNVYSIPFDAAITNEKGENVIYTVAESEQKYIAKQINVTTGMETDFYIEISSDELEDGMKIINDASAVHDGMYVTLN